MQLVRHFFNRFFDNELDSQQGEMRVGIIQMLALLAVPGLFISFYLFPKYVVLAFQPPYLHDIAVAVDKCMFLTLSTVIMGFISALEWDALFPDRRDYLVLGPLPIQLRTIFVAKLSALILFLLLFTAAINGVSSVIFPMATMDSSDTLLHAGGFVLTQAASLLAASAFVFFFMVALQGVLLNILSYQAFRRISICIQVLTMCLLLTMLFLFPALSSMLWPLKQQNSPLLYSLPPVWFLGLSETLQGTHDPVFRSLSRTALVGLGSVIGVSLITYLISYKRHVRKSLEASDSLEMQPGRVALWLSMLLDRTIIRRPLERAAFYFIGKTIIRSKKHRLILAAYVGVGLALVLEGLLSLLLRRGYAGVGELSPAWLSVPLILSFFLLSGMRVIFTIPSELRANWVFQLTRSDCHSDCLAGVKKAMFVFGVIPLFALLFPCYVLFWGWQTALLHVLYGITLSWMLIEILLANFHKIPFTCSYLPGKANLKLLFVLYWIAFSTYAYSMAALEVWMLRRPIRLLLFYALAAFVGVVYRRRFLDEDSALVYEERPDPEVLVLNLSHGAHW